MWFLVLTVCGWSGAVATARVARGPQYAIFVSILIGVYSLLALAVIPVLPWSHQLMPLLVAFHLAVYVNFVMLSRPRMRPLLYRILVSWPSAFFAAGTLLSLPWAVLIAFGLHPWGVWLPYLGAAIGMFQSLTTKRETVHLVVPGEASRRTSPPKMNGVAPIEREGFGEQRVDRPLRIVQLSDTHLGPFMSVRRLAGIAQRAVEANPDLILLTGDFLTMESQHDPELLLEAFAPLKALPGKVFACHGNHDHEAPEIVARALAANGIDLLVDDARDVQTAAGPVQIVGMDFTRRERDAHLAAVCRAHPRTPGALRIVLLHDPGAFRNLPAGEGDLVLAGHTHGGQVGLLSLGLSWTFLRMFGLRMPDHGLWSRGSDRLWVHRGTGHYGFPLRMGVPAEESVLLVHRLETP